MALERLRDRPGFPDPPADLYLNLEFPEPAADRPYIFINMVSTIDGKILIDPIGGTAKGLGSATDQLLMRRIEDNADCAMIGAGTLRAGNVVYAPDKWRAGVTSSGNLPAGNRFFTGAAEKALVFAPPALASNSG